MRGTYFQLAQDRREWKEAEETFVQQWEVKKTDFKGILIVTLS